MRLALIACVVAGCAQVFDIDTVIPTMVDASGYDGATLDTAGWPTDGGVLPIMCPAPGGPDEDGDQQDDACDNCLRNGLRVIDAME